MALVLVMGTVEQEVLHRLGDNPSTVRAGGGFGAVYAEEVLVEWGVTSAQLAEDGRISAAKTVDKFHEALRW